MLTTTMGSQCNIAILVVDMMEGLKPQTRESIQLLRSRKTPFVVALNKVDRLFGWKPTPGSPIEDSLNKQAADVKVRFEEKVTNTVTELAMEGFVSHSLLLLLQVFLFVVVRSRKVLTPDV